MKVRITFEANDEYRAAINHFYGKTGKASRQDVVAWFDAIGHSSDDDIIQEYRAALEEQEEGKL